MSFANMDSKKDTPFFVGVLKSHPHIDMQIQGYLLAVSAKLARLERLFPYIWTEKLGYISFYGLYLAPSLEQCHEHTGNGPFLIFKPHPYINMQIQVSLLVVRDPVSLKMYLRICDLEMPHVVLLYLEISLYHEYLLSLQTGLRTTSN